MTAPILPATRCPDCGTIGTGRICPACHYELWEHVLVVLDPDGEETLVDLEGLGWGWQPDGGLILSHRSGDQEAGTVRDELLFEGRPVTSLGPAWLRHDWTRLVFDKDLERDEPGPDPSGGGATSAGGWPADWVVCPLAWVLEFLGEGRDMSNTRLLDDHERREELQKRAALHPLGRSRSEVRFRDPGQHAAFRQFVAQKRRQTPR